MRPSHSASRRDETSMEESDESADEQSPKDRAREVAEEIILNSEKFKATLAPEGKSYQPILNQINQGPEQSVEQSMGVPQVDLNFDDRKDSEFTEMTCHVDEAAVSKIGKGQFLEIPKLIAKNQRVTNMSEEGRIEFFSKEGQSYWIPKAGSKEHEVKITDYRKWEQGFKVYAAIFAQINPHRGAEIWQYMHTIQLASQSFSWENVAYYDFMFRQNMAKYPQRSWKIINNQLWSLAMRDPIRTQNQNNSIGKKKDWRDNCCWRYNRNKCNRASSCRYDHRCSSCGSYSHILLNCHQK